MGSAAPVNAGGRAAEGLDLGGVVVGLVLEEEQPVLEGAVDVNLDLDGAGVDLLGLVEVLELAGVLEPLGADGAHVHEAHGLGVAPELVAHLHVAVEGGANDLVVKLDVAERRAEGGVAAVVRPVGVDHLDLGDRGDAALAGEVALAEGDVREVHGKAALVDEGLELRLVERQEVLEHLDVRRLGIALGERLARLETRLARLHGVDDVVLDGGDVILGERALEHVDLRGAHDGPLALGDELDALTRGVCALVKLAGEKLHGKHDGAGGDLWHLGGGDVGLRLREDRGHAARKELGRYALDVVAVDETQAAEGADAEERLELALERLCLAVEPSLFLHEDARDHALLPPGVPYGAL